VNSSQVLIDTSAWIHSIRRAGDAETAATVAETTASGRAVLCDMVLLELWNGATSDDDKETLRQLEAELELLETTAEVWARARRMARRSRDAGLAVPASDLLIAACAEHYEVELLQRDSHFDRLRSALANKSPR